MKFLRPEIDNPYPPGSGLGQRKPVISDFQYVDDLYLGRFAESLSMPGGREVEYFTARRYTVEFRVDGVPRILKIPAGCLNDLASIPRFARWYIGRVGPHLEACIVHDYLFVAWLLVSGHKPTRADWRFANEVLYAGLRAAGIGWFKRRLFRLALDSEVSWRRFEKLNGPDGSRLFVEVG